MRRIVSIVTKNPHALAIILLAAFLRLYRFGEFVTFLGDQGRDAIIIKRILTLEHFPAIGAPTSIGQVYLGPFYYYLMAPFLLISGFQPIGLAFGVTVISLAGLIAAYATVKQTTDKHTALLFTALAATSSSLIVLARFSWNPNLLPLFSFFALFFFYKLLHTKKNLYAILSGSFLSFAMQLHYLGLFLIVPMFVIGITRINKKFLLLGASFIFFSLPLLVFDLRHDFLNSKNFLRLFSEQNMIAGRSLLARILDTNQQFFNHVFRTTLYPWLAFVLMFLLLIVFLKLAKKNDFLFLQFVNVLSFLILFSFLNSPRHPHYYGPAYYSFFLILAAVVGSSWKKQGSHILRFLSVIFLLFYLISNVKNYYFFFNKGNNQIEKAQAIAQSLLERSPQSPYQTIAIPVAETDGHIRYFLETASKKPLPENSPLQPKELYVLCFAKPCLVIGNPQWQIAAFQDKKIESSWEIENVTIYKVVHGK